jgi:hypothetical protein
MPPNGKKPHEALIGKTAFAWSIPEFPKYERGKLWYAIAALVAGGGILYAVLTANFLFAVIILMFAMISLLYSTREPEMIPFAIGETGIAVGARTYPWREIESFWVVYDPPTVKTLYVEFKNPLRPRVNAPLTDEDPVALRDTLLQYIREDVERKDEPFSDFLGRLLKL